MDVKRFFEQHVPARLRMAPEVFSLGRVIAFDITGAGGGQWTLELRGTPSCHADSVVPSECTFVLSPEDFDTVLRGPSHARSLFRQGRIRVLGALSVAKHLPALLTMLSSPHTPSGIHTLFPHVPQALFFNEFWPETLAVFHGPLERIPEMSQVPGLQSVGALLSVWPGLLRLADRYGGREVDPNQARALYAKGHHLAFSDAEQVFPVLKGMLERLRWDLQLPINTFGRCPVYASPDGSGEALHFDQNANFIIQLKGEKLWQVAPNRHLTRPTDRYTTAHPVPSAELQMYGPSALPTSLPLDAETVHMKPGSVLFLPRGYWHQTQAVGESLSLNFTFDQPTWADLLPPDTRRRVLQQSAWRALALGAGNLDATAAQRAVSTLQALVQALPEELRDIDAEQAIGRMTPTEAANVLIPRTSEQRP